MVDNRIEKALLLIAKSFQTGLRVADLAAEANLSGFHFHRLFKMETNQTPLEYINTIKLEHAAHLLIMYPNSRQLEIAFECGYSSPAVFSRTFSAYYKMGPSAFRKKKSLAKKVPGSPNAGKRDICFSLEKNKIPIEYLQQKKIQVERVSLVGNALNEAYQKLIRNNSLARQGIGFYIDTPFHKKLENCRHYIGLDSDTQISKDTHFLDIPSGYYTHVSIQGSFKKIQKQIIAFKEKKIDGSGYIIKSLTAFERIKLPTSPSGFDYFSTPRDLYIQVGRK